MRVLLMLMTHLKKDYIFRREDTCQWWGQGDWAMFTQCCLGEDPLISGFEMRSPVQVSPHVDSGSSKSLTWGLPWGRSGWESACQCRGHGFEPWSRKIPHAAEQLLSLYSKARELQLLSPCAATTEARAPRACAPQQEKPPQWEAHAPQRRPNAAKKKKKKSLTWYS